MSVVGYVGYVSDDLPAAVIFGIVLAGVGGLMLLGSLVNGICWLYSFHNHRGHSSVDLLPPPSYEEVNPLPSYEEAVASMQQNTGGDLMTVLVGGGGCHPLQISFPHPLKMPRHHMSRLCWSLPIMLPGVGLVLNLTLVLLYLSVGFWRVQVNVVY